MNAVRGQEMRLECVNFLSKYSQNGEGGSRQEEWKEEVKERDVEIMESLSLILFPKLYIPNQQHMFIPTHSLMAVFFPSVGSHARTQT
jgi:hypothetical protein